MTEEQPTETSDGAKPTSGALGLVVEIVREHTWLAPSLIAVVAVLVLAGGWQLGLPWPVTILGAALCCIPFLALVVAFRASQLPKTTLTRPAIAAVWFSLGLLSVVAVLITTSTFFDVPMPLRSYILPTPTAERPPAAPLSSLRLGVRAARNYFEETTEGLKGTPDGRREVAKRTMFKASLAGISDQSQQWHSVILEGAPHVEWKTAGGMYVINVMSIEAHGADYSRSEPPLAHFFGWIERTTDGSLTAIPFAIYRDTSSAEYRLDVELPTLEPRDRVVVAIERRPGAKPESFQEGFTIDMIKK